MPDTWKQMNGNVFVFKLQNTDPEYTDIQNKFNASAGGPFTVQTVSKISFIFMPTLY